MQNIALHGAIIRGFVDDIVAAGAVVFGGAPRDLMLAQSATKAYYEDGGSVKDLDDPNVLPQHASRTLVPSDVDAIIAEDDMWRLESVWKHLSVKTMAPAFETTYLAHWPEGTKHVRYVFSYVRDDLFSRETMLAGFHPDVRSAFIDVVDRFAAFMTSRAKDLPRTFRLDLVIAKNRANVHGAVGLHPDFDVNGILMDARGLRLCESLVAGQAPLARHARLLEVLDNVFIKHAVFLGESDATNLRLQRLLARGWTATTGYVSSAILFAETGETCCVCKKLFTATSFTLPCCKAKYHALCLRGLVDRPQHSQLHGMKCVACKSDVSARRIFFDICAAEGAVRLAPD